MAVTTGDDLFLSTPSARRATRRDDPQNETRKISIHALREEGDVLTIGAVARPNDFYPRPPRGGRRCLKMRKKINPEISIHALREEGDLDDIDCF